MIRKVFLLFKLSLLFVLVNSCTKEIDIDIPKKEYRLVVNSTISPFILPNPQPIFANITRSIHISDTTLNTIVNDATVLLYNKENLIDTLHFVDTLGLYQINTQWSPSQGEEYSIVATHTEYHTIRATSTIPKKVEITDFVVTSLVSINEAGDPNNEIAITFKDIEDEKNYYEVVLSNEGINYYSNKDYYRLSSADRIIARENYYPKLERFDIEKPKYILFTDEDINGDTYTLHFNYIPPRYEDFDGEHIKSHYITIQLRSVTEAYYAYKTSLISQLNNQIEDVLYGGKEPENVYSNIENGYGLFSGFNYDTQTLFVDKVDY